MLRRSVLRPSSTDSTGRRSLIALIAVAALVVLVAASVPSPTAASAETAEPFAGAPWVISVGDSYISGEGGRWAGNTNGATSRNDALGPTAYFDNPSDTGELIPLCHRSKSAEVHIGNGVNSLNLACSGAETGTYWTGLFDDVFKPGIDFYDDGDGHLGQALMLQQAAADKDVKMVVLSIGGNDFDVSGALETCAEDYAESVPFDAYYCHTDPSVIAQFSDAAAAEVQTKIEGAITNIRTAMARAGHPADSYTLVVQDYPLPLPYGSQFRYPESGYSRIDTGGCGIWNVDVNFFVNDVSGVVSRTVRNAAAASGGGIELLELGTLLEGRRLCQTGVGLLEEEDLDTWMSPGAENLTEWANPIYVATGDGPHFEQESVHPDYWAQLALRNCLRQVWNDGSPHGGTCTHDTGLDAAGEPNTTLASGLALLTPVGGADTFSVSSGTLPAGGTNVVGAPGVLANDTDPSSAPRRSNAPDHLTVTLASAPAHGNIELRSDGSFTYAPDPGYQGTDTFAYRVANASERSDPVPVTLAVTAATPPPTAPTAPIAPTAPVPRAIRVTPAFTG